MSSKTLAINATLAGLQILGAGAALSDVVGAKPASFFVLIIAAAQGGMAYYQNNNTTPNEKIAAVVPNSASVPVAGPASEIPDGTKVAVTRIGNS